MAWTLTAALRAVPLAHKATHATGGTDALAPVDIGAAPAPGLWTALTINSPTVAGRYAATTDAGAYQPAYRVVGLQVQLRGKVDISGSTTLNDVIASGLPAGIIPGRNVAMTVVASTAVARVGVTSAGNLINISGLASPIYYALDGLSYALV